ncbi:MAG: biotin transporter BioY [Rhodospirillaceae bacterium]|nr:biotin transporter BioY [Rhodospirillaceae bacterium]
MNHAVNIHPTMITALLPTSSSMLRNVILAVLGSVLLTISAKIHIPFYPVPMTMQTFVVLGLGVAFGSRLGAATVLLYLAEGAAGLPVFSGTPEKGLGLAYMMGTTGGYLLGFVVAAWAVGLLAERGWDRGFASTAAAMVIGNAIIYSFGLLWLGSLLGWDKPIIEWGMTPFLLGDISKIALAVIAMPLAWKALGKRKTKN